MSAMMSAPRSSMVVDPMIDSCKIVQSLITITLYEGFLKGILPL